MVCELRPGALDGCLTLHVQETTWIFAMPLRYKCDLTVITESDVLLIVFGTKAEIDAVVTG